jgi:hypothetical protein
VCQNATDCVEMKSENCFQLHYTCSDRLFTVLFPLALSIAPSPSYCDVAQARVYLRPLYHGVHVPAA